MIPAGTYWDTQDFTLLLVDDFDITYSAYPYTILESTRPAIYTNVGRFKAGSQRANSLTYVPGVTSIAQLKLQYPELFI